VAVSDIVKYVIENSSMKDIIWKHLVELINCTTELSELVRTQALLHCDSLSTSGLDLEGERLDTIIADPDVLRNMMNSIVEFINCTNANNVSDEKFKSINKFESEHKLDLEKNIDAPASDNIDAYKKFCVNLMNEEINVCKYLRDLEKYHNHVIVESNKLFKKCNLLKKEFAKA